MGTAETGPVTKTVAEAVPWELWAGFAVVVVVMLYIDLRVAGGKHRAMTMREAIVWSLIWIGVAMVFNVALFVGRGSVTGKEFLTAYWLERSLSVDNIFAFAVLFRYFGVQVANQYRTLFWGIIAAVILRVALIAAGVELVNRLDWLPFLFGIFLLYTAWKLMAQGGTEVDPARIPIVRLFRRVYPVHEQMDGEKFFTRVNGKRVATLLFLTLLAVIASDIVFAVDSVPAIIAVTNDQFVALTSNVFAVLGMRALYFLLAGSIHQFYYLKHGLSLVLGVVGVKMMVSATGAFLGRHWELDPLISFAAIVVIVGTAIGASSVRARRLAQGDTDAR